MLEMRPHKYMGIAYSTNEAARDAALLGHSIGSSLASEAAFVLDADMMAGSGAGRVAGVLHSDCLVSVTPRIRPGCGVNPSRKFAEGCGKAMGPKPPNGMLDDVE